MNLITIVVWLFISQFMVIPTVLAPSNTDPPMYAILLQSASAGNEVYKLPPLPYDMGALKAAIDEETVDVHYNGHHVGYKNKMNSKLAEWRSKDKSGFDRFVSDSKNLVYLFNHLNEIPKEYLVSLRNVGGGFVNHIFYWSTMSASPSPKAQNALASDIDKVFGSLDNFKSEFTKQAGSLFGSGYVWLVRDSTNQLEIISLENQVSPISLGKKPILTIDVWEHAYYLQHKNKRASYINNWWKVVDWAEVDKLDVWWSKIKLDAPTNNSLSDFTVHAVFLAVFGWAVFYGWQYFSV